MKLKAEAQPKELQQQLERVVLEGNDARALLHKKILSVPPYSKKSVTGWVL
jgi:hypothetical protein